MRNVLPEVIWLFGVRRGRTSVYAYKYEHITLGGGSDEQHHAAVYVNFTYP